MNVRDFGGLSTAAADSHNPARRCAATARPAHPGGLEALRG